MYGSSEYGSSSYGSFQSSTLSGNDVYTPENDLSLSDDLASPDDSYTPENDLSLTEDLTSGGGLSFTLNSPSGGSVFSKPIGQVYTVGYDFNVDSESSGTVRLFENSTEVASFSHDGSGDLNFTYNADNIAGSYSWYVQFDDGSSITDSSTRSYSIDSTVSGTVYDDQGNILESADVVLVDETNQVVAGTTTSDSNGDYSFTIDGENDDVNAVFHVAAKYDDGNEKFNFFSNPFMEE